MIHLLHKYEKTWRLVVRKDWQGGEFWAKDCVICGHSKITETRPRWFL